MSVEVRGPDGQHPRVVREQPLTRSEAVVARFLARQRDSGVLLRGISRRADGSDIPQTHVGFNVHARSQASFDTFIGEVQRLRRLALANDPEMLRVEYRELAEQIRTAHGEEVILAQQIIEERRRRGE